jgi:hypothetical protein
VTDLQLLLRGDRGAHGASLPRDLLTTPSDELRMRRGWGTYLRWLQGQRHVQCGRGDLRGRRLWSGESVGGGGGRDGGLTASCECAVESSVVGGGGVGVGVGVHVDKS